MFNHTPLPQRPTSVACRSISGCMEWAAKTSSFPLCPDHRPGPPLMRHRQTKEPDSARLAPKPSRHPSTSPQWPSSANACPRERLKTGVSSGVSSFWNSVRVYALECMRTGCNPLSLLEGAAGCISVRWRKTHPKSGACEVRSRLRCVLSPCNKLTLTTSRTCPIPCRARPLAQGRISRLRYARCGKHFRVASRFRDLASVKSRSPVPG